MDRTERLNLADECMLTAWDLMACAQILRGQEDNDAPELLYDALAIRSRRSARSLMEVGAALTPKVKAE